jgi:hypothetical protein
MILVGLNLVALRAWSRVSVYAAERFAEVAIRLIGAVSPGLRAPGTLSAV